MEKVRISLFSCGKRNILTREKRERREREKRNVKY